MEATRHEAHPIADRHAGGRDDLAVEAPAAVELDDRHAGRLARGVDVVARPGDDGARAREALDGELSRATGGARRPLREDERSATRAPEPLEPQVLTALAPAPRARLVRRERAPVDRVRRLGPPLAPEHRPGGVRDRRRAVERLDLELLHEAARARDETAARREPDEHPRERVRGAEHAHRGRDVVAGPAEPALGARGLLRDRAGDAGRAVAELPGDARDAVAPDEARIALGAVGLRGEAPAVAQLLDVGAPRAEARHAAFSAEEQRHGAVARVPLAARAMGGDDEGRPVARRDEPGRRP